MNIDRAEEVLEQLAAVGVADICLCPGGRNSPFVMVLGKAQGFRLFTFPEERAAAFFALGRARVTKRPVAVMTTSGTAVAELLPAVIEAHYSGVPLVLITADRPKSYRGTGAPQAIEQTHLFGSYVSATFDLGDDDHLDLNTWDRIHSVHINICFDEPLVDREVLKRSFQVGARSAAELCQHGATAPRARSEQTGPPLQSFLRAHRFPLVLLGALEPDDIPAVRDFLAKLRAPIYAECHSQLREDKELSSLIFASAKGLDDLGCDAVLRIGGVPTTRFWRNLEIKHTKMPVCSVSPLPFTGLSRKSLLVQGELSTLLRDLSVEPVSSSFDARFKQDRVWQERLQHLLQEFPRSEPALVHELSCKLPRESFVYLGNSLPIREWDLAATREDRGWTIATNRGANGIDGQLSTFLGMCVEGRPNWAIVGDLTALYDLTAPWVVPQLGNIDFSIVVINNGGGKIFSRMFDEPLFENRHTLRFSSWAEMWNLPQQAFHELIPDEDQTRQFWDAYARIAP